MYYSQLKHTKIIDGELFVSGADAAEVFEPANTLLDDAATTVGLTIEFHIRVVPGLFVVFVRDHRFDVRGLEPVADALHAVAFVGSDLARFVPPLSLLPPASDQAGDRLADDRLGSRRFVRFTGGDFDGERGSFAVGDQVEFRSKAASAAAQRVVRRFVGVPLATVFSAPAAARVARTLAPSTHHNSQSIRPRVSSLSCNASTIAAKTPALRQLEKYRCTVWNGPKHSGRSRHGEPVARIHKIPSSITRRSLDGRPVVAVLCGISGEISSHWSSTSPCRIIIADLHVVMEGYRHFSPF